MKRSLRSATVWTFPGSSVEYVLKVDAYSFDARQRAEIRDLKKRLETARCRFAAMGMQAFVDECDLKKPLKEKR